MSEATSGSGDTADRSFAASVVVVTVVHGRHDHLRTQRVHLARCSPPPARHVVVTMDDPQIASVVADEPDLPTTLVEHASSSAGLPVAAARNAGARAALDLGAEILVFLDVDCLPSPSLVDDYRAAVLAHPGDILCGPVTYLPPSPAQGWTPGALARARAPHPARPDPAPGEVAPIGPALFWSLSFALTAPTWDRLPGFYEGYVGYGGEDTDFGYGAVECGVRILFFGGADAYHQHHPVSDPPTEHLDDIVRNSVVFRRRHGHLPMSGWLGAFREAGLITDVDGLPRRTAAPRVLTIPARHPYLDAVLPTTIERVETARVVTWEPDPLLEPAAFAAAAPMIDVVHVHFSYEHLEVQRLGAWLDAVRAAGVPLVVTVHDLRNPHVVDPQRHDNHLRLLLAAAAHVFTLTGAAAEECRRRVDRAVEVLAHPTLLDVDPKPGAHRPVVLVPLKALRANVLDVGELVGAVAGAALEAGMRTRVLLEPDRPSSRAEDVAAIERLAADNAIDLDTRGHLPEAELLELVAGAHACVLPYRWGTHSGWVELCRDLGTRVVAPDCGLFAAQWSEVFTYANNERDGLDAASLRGAVGRACRAALPQPADRTARLADRDVARAVHDVLYRRLTDPARRG